jgi:DNA-binding transcriptional regulator YiaG
MPVSYPEEPVTIGEHIRKKRMDLKLRQSDCAKLLKVTAECVFNWEVNRNEPQIQFYPQIIDFLGYLPFDIDTSTFGGKLKFYRYRNGLSLKQFGKNINSDGPTIYGWEIGQNMPPRKKLAKLELMLKEFDSIV